MLTCSRDDTLRIVDLRQCRIVQLMSAPGFKVASDYSRATIAPDGVFAAAGSMVCTVLSPAASTSTASASLRAIL